MSIQKLRLQHGWSQEQLADVSGLSVRTIQRLEGGQPASLESLKALAAVFNVDLNVLKEPRMTVEAAAPSAASNTAANEEMLAFMRVRRIRSFYLHAIQYGLVVAGLAIVNMVFSPKHFWVAWVALGWGIGLMVHGLRVFDCIPFFKGDWERRQVEKILGRRL